MALTGTPSKFSTQVEHLAAGLPDLLKRRTQTKHVRQRQAQRRLTPEQMAQLAAEYEAGDSMKAWQRGGSCTARRWPSIYGELASSYVGWASHRSESSRSHSSTLKVGPASGWLSGMAVMTRRCAKH